MKSASKDWRQVETVSIILRPLHKFSVADLCAHFEVETATIHRDMQELRSLGISIHSVNGVVRLTRSLVEKDVRVLLSKYLAVAGNAVAFPKSTSLLVKKLKAKSIVLFCELVNAIDAQQSIEILYYKMSEGTEVKRTIEPYQLFSTTRDWRLIAKSDCVFKQFLVENIKEVKRTHFKFKRDKGFDPGELFKMSFEYWGGGEIIDVELRFSQKLGKTISAGIWGEEQEMIAQADGSVILKMKANSLEQIGNWVLTWGGEVKVIQPKLLHAMIIDKARSFLSANKT